MQRDASYALLLICFLLSGLAGLVYELVWTREFATVFGSSSLAVATVLAAYMAGLAAGASVAARFVHRLRRPVLSYGLLEMGIAVSALAVPLAIQASRSLYVVLFGGLPDLPDTSGLAPTLFYLVCAFAILMVPTSMMGATLPLLAQHVVRRNNQVGSRSGQLYAANTAGAVIGTLLAAFVLVPTFGLRHTVWIAAGVNGLVFLIAWRLAAVVPSPVAPQAALPTGPRFSWILPLIAGSGFVSFTYEVLWVRLLEHVLGGSVYAFATMLASFLLGIAVGSAVAGRLGYSRGRAALAFAVAQLCTAALSLAAFWAADWIPALTVRIAAAGVPTLWGGACVAILTLFPAAVAIGATFPLAVRVLARDERDAGRANAHVYTANALGSIAGSVAAGFLLIPALGFAGTMIACAVANLVLAGLAALLPAGRHLRPAVAAIAGLVLVIVLPPQPPWNVLTNRALSGAPRSGELEYFGVGRTAAVSLFRRRGRWNLRTNGLPEASIDRPGLWHGRSWVVNWLGALPVVARPATRSMFVVGLGGGVALENVPSSVERIDVVELEQEVVAANRVVGSLRWRNPLDDPRVSVHIGDARNTLLLTERRFDAIVSQPSHPWTAGSSNLYTREFFELVRDRLTQGGTFVQWIGLRFVDEALFRTLLATMTSVYPHVQVYRAQTGGVLFLASDEPLDLWTSSASALGRTPEDFARLGVLIPEDVAAWLAIDEQGTRALGQGAAVNRDGNNQLQARSSRLGGRTLLTRFDELVRSRDPLVERLHHDPFPLLRRLPAWRSEALAESLRDPATRRVALGIAAEAGNKPERAKALAAAALAEDAAHPEARALMLRLFGGEIRRGGDIPSSVPLPLSPSERAVTDGWHVVGESPDEAGASLAGFEAALAAIGPREPLWREAQRLRMRWRIDSGEPERAQEAVGIADRMLRVPPLTEDLLLRATACAAAADWVAAVETLFALEERLGGAPRDRALAIAALQLTRSIALQLARKEEAPSDVEAMLAEAEELLGRR